MAGDRYFDLGGGYGIVMSEVAGFVPLAHVAVPEGGPDLGEATGFVMAKGRPELIPVYVDFAELRAEFAIHIGGGEGFAAGWDGEYGLTATQHEGPGAGEPRPLRAPGWR